MSLVQRQVAVAGANCSQFFQSRWRFSERLICTLGVLGAASVSQPYDTCDRIDRSQKEEAEEALISLLVEPEDRTKRAGIVVL